MLKSLLVFLCFLCFTAIHAQQSIIASTDTRVFYSEIQNPIKVILDGVDSSEIIVECYNGVITGNYGNYNVKVQLGPSRLCTVKAGVLKENGDTLWIREQEFKIRPRPPVFFTINGKEGGGITMSELMVWNFVNVSYGPTFSKDGYMLTVLEYDIVCESRNEIVKIHKKSSAIGDSMRIVLSKLDNDASISFYNFKYKEVSSGKIYDVSSVLTFTLFGEPTIENTIYQPLVKFKKNEQEEIYRQGSIYQYIGHWVGDKKDGLWVTQSRKCPDKKVGETIYHLDTILKETQYYSHGAILCETKFIYKDTTAYLTTYYDNGKICYQGKYKVDYSHGTVMEFYNGAYDVDYFYNDTTFKTAHDPFEIMYDKKVLLKPLFGEWKFYYPNGTLAAKGYFISRLQVADGDFDNPPPYY